MQAIKPPNSHSEPLSVALAIVAVLALALCAALTWLQLGHNNYLVTAQEELQNKQAAVQQQFSQLSAPTLKLNQDNQQQGPDITVNPDNLGKPDPFLKTQ